ncbi:MAG: hypothetical protein MUC42_03210, partial [Bryobacter sp.]|nr:hypothetical protein [Bryobacter sp.]
MLRALALLLAAQSLFAAVGVRILLGVGDRQATTWDGGVTVRNARLVSLDPWRFDDGDQLLAGNRWKMRTHLIRLFGAAGQANRPFVANGVVLMLDGEGPDTSIQVETAQGSFEVSLRDVPFGTRTTPLGGRALVDRVPFASRVTNGSDEQDYPAAAVAKDGTVWVAYLEFKHHPEHDRIRSTPNDFSLLDLKPGGDQILLKKFANGSWSAPIPVSGAGGDLYRPAVAMDGRNRVWVIWPQHERGDFELYARSFDNGQPGPVFRLTTAPGTDMDPVATTDSSGRVWIAWQGWRGGRGAIFAAAQNGDRFGAPQL